MSSIIIIFKIFFILLGCTIAGFGLYQKFILPIKIDNKSFGNMTSDLIFSQKTKGNINGWPRNYIRLKIYSSHITVSMDDLFRVDGFQIKLNEILKIEKKGIFSKKIMIIHKNFEAPEKIILNSVSSIDTWGKLKIPIY